MAGWPLAQCIALSTLVVASTGLASGQQAAKPLSTAGQLVVDGNAISGYAVAAHEMQVAGGALSVSASSAAFDAFLLLVGPDGETRSDDDSGGDRAARIEVSAATPGRWLAIVTTFGAGAEGPYTLVTSGADAVQPAGAEADTRALVEEAFATRGVRDEAAEQRRRAELLGQMLTLPSFREALLARLRAGIAEPVDDDDDEREFERLEQLERTLTEALPRVSAPESGGEVVAGLVQARLEAVRAEIAVLSAELTARVEQRAGYGLAVRELEALDTVLVELDRVRSLVLRGVGEPDQLAALRLQATRLQADADTRIASLVEKLLASRFVEDFTFGMFDERRYGLAERELAMLAPAASAAAASASTAAATSGSTPRGTVPRTDPSLYDSDAYAMLLSRPGAVAYTGGSTSRPDPSVWLPSLFPWPPPQPSSTFVITDADIPGWQGRFSTLGQLDAALRAALDEAGYGGPSYWGVRDGFAMVTPLEQVDASGQPLAHEPSRWGVTIAPMKAFSLAEYVRALLTAPAGYFRVIVFVVTPHAFTTDGERGRFSVLQRWASAGHAFLPDELGRQAYTADHRVTVLVYEFEKRSNAEDPTTSIPGRHRAKEHLVQSRVMTRLLAPLR